jgi:type II secretory pathway pseudopilin PulG
VRKTLTKRANERLADLGERGALRDAGHSGVEMIAVLGLVGVLASATALLITGMSTQAAEAGCATDGRALATAAASYLAATGGRTIAAAGTDADRFELALVEHGFLGSPSAVLDLDAHGAVVTPEGSPC